MHSIIRILRPPEAVQNGITFGQLSFFRETRDVDTERRITPCFVKRKFKLPSRKNGLNIGMSYVWKFIILI